MIFSGWDYMGEKVICMSSGRAIVIAAEHTGMKPKEPDSFSLLFEEDAYRISFCNTGQSIPAKQT